MKIQLKFERIYYLFLIYMREGDKKNYVRKKSFIFIKFI